MPDITILATNIISLNAKINEVKGEISITTNLATAPTTVENETLNVSNLVERTD